MPYNLPMLLLRYEERQIGKTSIYRNILRTNSGHVRPLPFHSAIFGIHSLLFPVLFVLFLRVLFVIFLPVFSVLHLPFLSFLFLIFKTIVSCFA